MLNLDQINEQLAKGDPKLKDVYLKLKEKAEGKKVANPIEPVKLEAAPEPQPVVVEEEARAEETTVYTCSKCQKICANGTGLSAHERKCKA